MEKKVLEKLDNIDGRLDRIEITQVEQAADLKHHIMRTDKLQEMVEPIYKRDQQVIGMIKFITTISGIILLIKIIKSFL